jgi:hypothetical protein
MIRALVYQIYRMALVVALLAASMGVGLLLNPMFEGVSPAAEVLQVHAAMVHFRRCGER